MTEHTLTPNRVASYEPPAAAARRPRVIFVTREGYDLPGARIRCYQFARELATHGVRTDVLSFADTLGAKSGAREHEMGLTEKLWFNARACRWLADAGEAVIILSRCNYHIFGPALYHLKTHCPLLLDLDDWEMRDQPTYRWGWYPTSKAHWLTRWLAHRSRACLAASHTLQELLRPWNTQVHYLPTGVDTRRFRPAARSSARATVVFGWIGTFHHRQYVEDLRWLVDCFGQSRRQLPHARLDIVGDGRYRAEVLSLLHDAHDDRIMWRGWIAPDEMPSYLETIDVGCYPQASVTPFSLAKSPTKVFEYMAMGKAVLASAVGEATHIIRHGDNGLLARTPPECLEWMVQLGEDASLRQRLGGAAVSTVQQRYALSVLGRRLYELLHHMVPEIR